MLERNSVSKKEAKALATVALILASLAVAAVNENDIMATLQANAAPTCTNIPIASASASGSENTNLAGNAIDNNLNTRWSNKGIGSWLRTDLGQEKIVCSVDIAWYKGNTRTNSFIISVSVDGTTYTNAFTGKSSGKIADLERYSFAEITARFVKVTVTGVSNGGNSEWVSIAEIDVNGYVPSDTIAPSVSITSPADGSSMIMTNGRVTIQGTASDNGALKLVEVRIDEGSYVAATPKSAGDWSSWSMSVDLGTSGSHRIVPRATDNAGNQAWNSIFITAIIDSTAPLVTVTSPSNGATVPVGTLVVQGTTSDNTGGSGIKSVQIRLDGGSFLNVVPKSTNDWSSWTASFGILTAGSHTFQARATDKAGNYKDSSVAITTAAATTNDTTAPIVAITNPTGNSVLTITGGNIAVSGIASDSESGVRIVEVRIDEGSYVAATPKSAGDWSTWTVTLPITVGEHRLVPRAMDNAGNQAWNSIYVTITDTPSGSSDTGMLDQFGIKKVYPTASGGNEWYVNMNDPRSDPNFRNLPSMTKQPDGSWQVTASQVRMEAWSPSGEKWLNVEITGYAKMVGGSNELVQLYSRGGHHFSDSNKWCEGSAYKARLYGDGQARWVKEVMHPSYTSNRGSVQATETPLMDRWVGFKAVMYNFVENGKTYVRMESYIDDDVTDSSGNLVIGNNWVLASVVEDKGGWSTSNPDFDPTCAPLNKDSTQQYRQRDEILNLPGGTSTQNIAAWRSDSLTWNWKYLSVREIVAP
jgi:hypothetical protein